MPPLTPTISATVLGGLPEFITSNFGRKELNLAYAAAGIPAGLDSVQHAYIPEASLITFLDSIARLCGEDQIGLMMAPQQSIDPFGVMANYIRGAGTLGEGIMRFTNLFSFHASHNTMAIRRQGDKVRWTYKYSSPGTLGYVQLVLASIGTQINFVREFADSNWLPDRIELDILKPRNISLFEQTFACPIIFGAPEICHVFDRDLLKQSRRWTDDRLVTASEDRKSVV